MGRLAKAEEIAPIVIYLASDESAFATGQIFSVDGGMTIEDMKLVRYGPAGKEKPGLIDADGKLRDLSKKVKDIDGRHARARRARQAQEARHEEAAARQGQAAPRALRRDAVEVRRDRPQLRRSREGNGLPHPRASGRLLQDALVHRRRQRQRDDAQGIRRHRLGSRDRIRDGPQGDQRRREDRVALRRGLLHLQRRLGARVPDEAQRLAVEQGQGLRHFRPARALARDGRRGQGRAEPRHVARRQRPAQADRQHARR